MLGVQWMMGLGEIQTNYRHLTMDFLLNGKLVKLQGERPLRPRAVNSKTLKKMAVIDSVASFFHLRVVEEIEAPTVESFQQPEV